MYYMYCCVYVIKLEIIQKRFALEFSASLKKKSWNYPLPPPNIFRPCIDISFFFKARKWNARMIVLYSLFFSAQTRRFSSSTTPYPGLYPDGRFTGVMLMPSSGRSVVWIVARHFLRFPLVTGGKPLRLTDTDLIITVETSPHHRSRLPSPLLSHPNLSLYASSPRFFATC